ncbi:MmcB family DNA repair protein [Sphingorhabdus sp. SMR4y]|uniref:MmcB family DNA repair protein n=1 Tax=Sphingorhabdus sp. SMR4y TaxID=2584094 RepID=UPI000B5C9C6B|nr:MmcB family DNA repair protein [Sphingorhabdus sp. SMR4y]ASK89029.1 DNA repair protein MmcB-like protein [Sphingorhabdus sp. SMR4y]
MTFLDDSSGLLATSEPLTGAPAVARGVARMFMRHDIMVLPEVSLRNRRRADLMGIDAKGQIVIVEIKVARSDLLGDSKWIEYLDYCDRFYWALPVGFDASPVEGPAFLPERTGLIIADAYDAEMVRAAATKALAPARRRTETMRLARRAMQRSAISDGWISPGRGQHEPGSY